MKNRILILTGAGLSAESGIRTFRDSDGLWEEYDIMEVCSADGFRRDREKVLNFYDMRRKDLETREPNDAHRMIADIKKRYPENVFVVTQNVDNLLEKAECPDVIHLHGTLTDGRCEDCGLVFPIGYESTNGKLCPECGSDSIRHNVVMFQEPVPEYEKLYSIISETDLFVVIGTSGQVIDVGGIAQYYRYSVLNNKYPEPFIDNRFSMVLHESATEAQDRLKAVMERFVENYEFELPQ